jgi:hypothetical protein
MNLTPEVSGGRKWDLGPYLSYAVTRIFISSAATTPSGSTVPLRR